MPTARGKSIFEEGIARGYHTALERLGDQLKQQISGITVSDCKLVVGQDFSVWLEGFDRSLRIQIRRNVNGFVLNGRAFPEKSENVENVIRAAGYIPRGASTGMYAPLSEQFSRGQKYHGGLGENDLEIITFLVREFIVRIAKARASEIPLAAS